MIRFWRACVSQYPLTLYASVFGAVVNVTIAVAWRVRVSSFWRFSEYLINPNICLGRDYIYVFVGSLNLYLNVYTLPEKDS
jgi:hypothetical protein